MSLHAILSGFALPSLNTVSLGHPQACYLFAGVAGLLAWSLWRAGMLRRWPAPILRAIALSMLVLALADPHAVTHSEGVTRPVMIDASASITPAMRAAT